MVPSREASSRASRSPVTVVGLAAAIAFGVLAGSGCASDTGGPIAGSPSPATTATGPSASNGSHQGSPDVGFRVPDGFRFVELSTQSELRHGGLLTAVPGAFLARRTWVLSVSGIAGTVSRLAIAPDYAFPAAAARVDDLLEAVSASPYGSDWYEARTSRGVRVVRAHWAWIDTYAWVDPRGGAVWVLTESMDSHQGEWPGLIDALIEAQAV